MDRAPRLRLTGAIVCLMLLGALAPLSVGTTLARATPAARGTPATGTPVPNTPVGKQLSWLLGVLDGGIATLTPDGAQAHLAPSFQRSLPPDKFVITLQIAFEEQVLAPPVTLTGFAGTPTATAATALVSSPAGRPVAILIEVEATAPYLITNLALTPQAAAPGAAVSPATSPAAATPAAAQTWDQLDAQAKTVAPEVGILAAELVNGQCEPIHALNADQPLALGSEFKLYVLGELAHQIQQGKLSWDQPLAIHEDWKSLPGGFMQYQPAGATFPIWWYAEEMIAISDNTAADHLVHTLGAANVEAYQTAMGNSHAALNNPFLTTREMFTLKVAVRPFQTAEYINGTAAERAKLLANVVDKTPLTLQEAAHWTNPAFIGQIEWFASPDDICHAMSHLQALSAQPGLSRLKDILSINPGLPLNPKTWTYVGYKGGSENGVLTLGFLLQRHDGRWFVLSTMFNNPKALISQNSAILVGFQATNLLAAAK